MGLIFVHLNSLITAMALGNVIVIKRKIVRVARYCAIDDKSNSVISYFKQPSLSYTDDLLAACVPKN